MDDDVINIAHVTARTAGRSLLEYADNTPGENLLYIILSICLVIAAGLMSGLTLGLMSLDTVEMEVLKRSGTSKQRQYAARIMPVIANPHFLLVTLLLCNAAAMETLPIFLDRLTNPAGAIAISVTAVLVFGEILPQAVCKTHGLVVGAYLSWFVRVLMLVTSPISWPIGKLLDRMLGTEHNALFRRGQLKALVDIHGEEEGLGGVLTEDEVQVICGALDLTSKTARKSMTPLEKIFMLSNEDKLTEATCRHILASGHSRIPVYKDGNRSDIIGLILVKELLQYKTKDEVPIAQVRMRSLPRLPADTPMYDMLKLFETGRSHMAVLTDPGDMSAHPPPNFKWQDHMAAQQLEQQQQGRDFIPAVPAGADAPQEVRLTVKEDTSRAPSLERQNSDPAPFPEHQFSLKQSTAPAIGIITIEDVIEELMQVEIVDETDMYVDNEKSIIVNKTALAQSLPVKLRRALASQPDWLQVGSAASGHGWNLGGGIAGGPNSKGSPTLQSAVLKAAGIATNRTVAPPQKRDGAGSSGAMAPSPFAAVQPHAAADLAAAAGNGHAHGNVRATAAPQAEGHANTVVSAMPPVVVPNGHAQPGPDAPS